MPCQIRHATAHDIDALVPLFDGYRQFYRQLSDPSGARVFLSERLAHADSLILLATLRGAAAGFTQLYPLFSSVHAVRTYVLNDLFVLPSARRQGVAKALLQNAALHAREHGARSLSLSTALDNAHAQALYESLGWTRDAAFCHYDLVL